MPRQIERYFPRRDRRKPNNRCCQRILDGDLRVSTGSFFLHFVPTYSPIEDVKADHDEHLHELMQAGEASAQVTSPGQASQSPVATATSLPSPPSLRNAFSASFRSLASTRPPTTATPTPPTPADLTPTPTNPHPTPAPSSHLFPTVSLTPSTSTLSKVSTKPAKDRMMYRGLFSRRFKA
jgi:hypothetical protein